MKKNLKLYVLLAVLIVAFVALLVMLGKIPSPSTYFGPANLTEALENQRSALLNSGDTVALKVNSTLLKKGVTFTSSNQKVATVDEFGVVTAVGKGNAIITIADEDETLLFGVIVDGKGSMIDITKQTAKVLFSDIMLHAQTEITGMAIDTVNNAVYFAQGYGPSAYIPMNSDIMISKVELVDQQWKRTSWMRFTGSGKGTLCMDMDGAKARFWMECGGDYMSYGKAISLVEWEDYGYRKDSFGTPFQPQGITNMMTVSADPNNNMVLVYDRSAKSYFVYDREDMLSGNEQPEYLHKFSCPANQKPAAGRDDSQGRYNASVRGYVLSDGYLYQLSGSSSIYLSVFDMNGKLQYCHRITDHPDLQTRQPASIACVDGKIYITVASGNETCYLANVWVFE